MMARLAASENRCGSGWGHRHRVDRGNDHRGRDRQRELAEELTGNAAQEGARQKYRTEHQRDRDDRPGDFAHRVNRRFTNRQTFFQPAFDILEHDDGVVDHDADREHESKEREIVEREAHQPHDRERADQRDADVDNRKQQRLPILQEQQHDDRDQDHGIAQRFKNFPHRLVDKRRRVVGNVVLQAHWKPLFQFAHFRLNHIGSIQCVRTGKLKDCQTNRWLRIQRQTLILILAPSSVRATSFK